MKWQRKKRKDTDGKQNMNALGNLLLYNKGYLFGIKRDRIFFIVEIIRDLNTGSQGRFMIKFIVPCYCC